MRVLGAVLAGGASSRFGSDKALAILDGLTLLDHARAALERVVGEVVVVGRDGGVPDRPEAGLGPLGGIAGALDHGARHGFASVLTIGCDMPGVPNWLLERLLAEAPACCRDAPVLGHWPTALAPALLSRLASFSPSPRPRAGVHGPARSIGGDPVEPWMSGPARHDGGDGGHVRLPSLSVRRWAQEIGALAIPAPAALANVNTPADLPA